MSGATWVDGTFVEAGAAAVPASDHGLLLGDGVYSTLAVRNGRAVALDRHLSRLFDGLTRMGIALPDEARLRESIALTLERAGADAGRLRVTVTSGDGPQGLARGGKPRVMIAAGPHVAHGACHAVTGPWVRNERSALAGIKATSHAENVVMAQHARSLGATECLLLNTQGHLCEGLSSNVFVEQGGEVLTPPVASGCLPGIARALILEWSQDWSLPVREAAEGELDGSVFARVKTGEAWCSVSSSTRGLQPVLSLDGVATNEGALLAQVSRLYAERLDRETQACEV